MAEDHKIQVTQERVFSSGILSVTTNYRLVMSGAIGLKEIERLIRILTVQKEIMEEVDADEEASCASETADDEAATSPRPDSEAEPSAEGGPDGINSSEAA